MLPETAWSITSLAGPSTSPPILVVVEVEASEVERVEARTLPSATPGRPDG